MRNSGAPVQRIGVARARARAEFTEWEWLLAEYHSGVDELEDAPGSWHWRAEENGVVLDLALASGYSEHETRTRINAMTTLRDRTPMVWLSFRDGRIDGRRAQQIANTVGRLEHDESVLALDQNVVSYAETHTNAELRRWLTKFEARIEPVTVNDAAERARALRHVRVTTIGDGMACLSALLPAPVANAIDRRLTRAAKNLTDEPGQHRTVAQRRADLLGAWLTHCDEGITTAAVNMDIAVVVPVEALAGHSDLPAASYDWEWTAPADWLIDLAGTGNTLWHRIVTDPAGHILDHTYLGRFAPDILKTALAYRDQVCSAPGCTRPAASCEADHVIAHPRGPTAGYNLDSKCRRHHTMKGSGVLSPGLTRPRHSAPRPQEHEPTLDVSFVQHQLAEMTAERAA